MGLRGDDHAVGELLPPGVAVLLAHQRLRVAGVPHHDRQLGAGRDLLAQVDDEPVGALAVVAQAGADDADLRDVEVRQVEDDPLERLERDHRRGSPSPDSRLPATE